ncbi:MAG: ATP-binding protein [Clostridia bacterium]|nr:ATP-binding protein [Clostridia bacterium]
MISGKENRMLTRLVFRLLPVQIMIVAMGSINSLVDGVVASRCISPTMVGVVGLYYSMLRVMEAIGAVLLGGTSVLCGRYMGRGEIEKTSGVFSLNLTVTLLTGTVLTAVSVAAPDVVARVLGANQELEEALVYYILGYSIGIIPQLLSQQLAFFLQLERASKTGYLGVAAMILMNTGLDILFVGVWKMNLWGLALATSVSNWVYFLILFQHYLGKDRQLAFHPRRASWHELPELLKIGFSGALLVFCLTIRSIVINRVLLRFSGGDALSSMTAFNMISGILLALPLGMGAVVRMLTSVFVGEEDGKAIQNLISVSLGQVMLMVALIGAAVFLFSHGLAHLYFADTSSQVFHQTWLLFRIYSICIPMVLFCAVSANYFQAVGRIAFVNVVSVFDGFLSMVIPALLLAPRLGATGVWLSLPIGIAMTALLGPLYSIISCRRIPRCLSEWLLLHQVLKEEGCPRFEGFVQRMEDVTVLSEKAGEFCLCHGIERVRSSYCALCVEEMAGNIVRHGFRNSHHGHSAQVRILIKKREVLLRMKDDGIPFNPRERAELLSGEKPYEHIGIRMIFKLASEVEYQNLMGLNVLSIRIG